MLSDRVSNPGPLTYESGALPIALRGPAGKTEKWKLKRNSMVTPSETKILRYSSVVTVSIRLDKRFCCTANH